jgi:hypothetical protein
MYWSDWGRTGRIERAAMDGTRNEILLEKLGRANGLTIDFIENRLFWTALDTPSIESSDLSGLYRRTIVAAETQKLYGLTQYQVSYLTMSKIFVLIGFLENLYSNPFLLLWCFAGLYLLDGLEHRRHSAREQNHRTEQNKNPRAS